jgi:hypothetical protein
MGFYREFRGWENEGHPQISFAAAPPYLGLLSRLKEEKIIPFLTYSEFRDDKYTFFETLKV